MSRGGGGGTELRVKVIDCSEYQCKYYLIPVKVYTVYK